MTNPCEACETTLSALLDGEMEAEEVRTALDHLLDCPSCQDFYRDARALDSSLRRPLQKQEDERTLDRVWEAVDRESFGEPAARRRWRTWAPRLAAAVLLALGTSWAALSVGGRELSRPEQPIQVELGEGANMTEERFIQIATEILRSDRRYQQEMLRVMSAVAEETEPRETPVDQDLAIATEPAREREDRGPTRPLRRAT